MLEALARDPVTRERLKHVQRQIQSVRFLGVDRETDAGLRGIARQLPRTRYEPFVNPLALQKAVAGLQRRQLHRDSRALLHRSCGLGAQCCNGPIIGVQIARRIGLGARTFTQHVVRAKRQGGIGAAALEGRFDRVADDEGVPYLLHRLPQRGTQHGRDQRLRQGRCGEASRELPGYGREQSSDRAQNSKARAQQHAAPAIGVAGLRARRSALAQGGEALRNELVGTRRIRSAQQRLRKAHEGPSLDAVQRELLEYGVDKRTRLRLGSGGVHPTRGPTPGGAQLPLNRTQRSQQIVDGDRFIPQRCPADLAAQIPQPVRSDPFCGSRCSHASAFEPEGLAKIVNYSYNRGNCREYFRVFGLIAVE